MSRYHDDIWSDIRPCAFRGLSAADRLVDTTPAHSNPDTIEAIIAEDIAPVLPSFTPTPMRRWPANLRLASLR
jgi:hypothetical protein